MPVLSSRLHLREARHGLQTEGAFFVPEALTDHGRQEIQQEIEHHSYVVLHEQVGPVRTQAELFLLEDMAHLPAPIDQLHRELTHLVHEDLGDIEGVDLWHPNDVSIQRYAPNTQGISPHLDSKRYVHLMAIFTTEGSALFRLSRTMSSAAGTGRLICRLSSGISRARFTTQRRENSPTYCSATADEEDDVETTGRGIEEERVGEHDA
jgi:hypothetical protein